MIGRLLVLAALGAPPLLPQQASSPPAPPAAAPRLAVPPGPTLQESIAAALTRNSLPVHRARQAIVRARLAGLLPTIDVTLDSGTDRGYRLDSAPGEGDALTRDGDVTRGVRVRASFELHRLVFDPDELRATRAALDVLDHRAALIEQVTTLFVERRLLLSASGNESQAEALARLSRIAAIEGLLEALTGLPFSRVAIAGSGPATAAPAR